MRNEIAIALPSDKYDELVAKAKAFDNGDPNLPPCSSYFTKAMYRSIRTISRYPSEHPDPKVRYEKSEKWKILRYADQQWSRNDPNVAFIMKYLLGLDNFEFMRTGEELGDFEHHRKGYFPRKFYVFQQLYLNPFA